MITIEILYKINENDSNKTIADILRNRLNISARLLNKLKMNKKILVNDNPVYSNYIVKKDDLIKVKIDFVETDYIEPEKMDLDILYEDEYFLAVNKPAGIVVHPSANHLNNTLANGVKYYLNNQKKIRPINRLDRDTSGIVLFAKNEYIQELMIKNKIEKEYIAITDGILNKKEDIINLPIARKPESIMERCVSADGQTAITQYKVIQEIDNKYSVILLKLHTGRTHQIRVHLSYIGAPILGDTLYGKASKIIDRQALHAHKIEFVHPITNQKISIIAPIPNDMNERIIKKNKRSQEI